MQERSSSLIKNTSILSFGTLCTKGIMFIMTPLFTRWLSTSDYGTFDLLSTYISLLIPLMTISSGEAIFRFLLDEKDQDNRSKIQSTAFFLDVVGVILFLVICSIWVHFTEYNQSTIIGFCTYFVTEIFYNYCMMSMRGEKKLNLYAIGNILFVVGLAIFVTIFVPIMGLGLCGIFLGYACGDIFAIIVMIGFSKLYRKISIKYFSLGTLKQIITYSLPMIPNSISWWIMSVSDRSFITMFLGSELNAIYAVANKVPGLCTTFFNVFHLSWQQSATETMSDSDRDAYYSSVMNNMFRIIGSICILILGINFWFFKLLFTEDYSAGMYQAPILVVAIVFSMLSQFIGGIYVAQMRSKRNGISTAFAAIVNVIVDLALMGQIGVYAASLSTFIAYFLLFIVRYVDVRREISLKFEAKSLLLIFVLVYFFATSYISNGVFQAFNFAASCIVFVVVNFEYVKKILSRVIKRS